MTSFESQSLEKGLSFERPDLSQNDVVCLNLARRLLAHYRLLHRSPQEGGAVDEDLRA